MTRSSATLRPGAERRIGHHLGAELVQQTESEVTKLGRWLRATQLDEIPQFWNVFRGDMSLVGPRVDPAALLRGARRGAARATGSGSSSGPD